MGQLLSWRLRHWILAGYAVPLVALTGSAAIAIANANHALLKAKELNNYTQISEKVGDIAVDVQVMSRTTRGYLLAQDQISLQTFQEAKAAYRQELAALEDLKLNETQQQVLAKLKAAVTEWETVNQNLLDMASRGEVDEAIDQWRNGDGRQTAVDATAIVNEIAAAQETEAQAAAASQEQALIRLKQAIAAATGASLVLSVLLGSWIVHRTARQMHSSANHISTSTAEIAASIEQQERIASQQATSVNETTTTIDELGASSRQSAEQAEAAANGAQQALSLSEGGAQAVEKTLSSMQQLREKVNAIADQILRLSEQTSQIGSISGLVSDLANQTNMLALNAAVEAVRAGDHGKGFAVVSGEIRKLADQSKQSADKINALVNDIQNAINSTVMVTDEGTKTVEISVDIANETAHAFAGVTDAMNNVVLNSQQISLNVQQQAVAIQQVVTAMNGLNVAAQETASGISQIKTGTQRLNDAAIGLTILV